MVLWKYSKAGLLEMWKRRSVTYVLTWWHLTEIISHLITTFALLINYSTIDMSKCPCFIAVFSWHSSSLLASCLHSLFVQEWPHITLETVSRREIITFCSPRDWGRVCFGGQVKQYWSGNGSKKYKCQSDQPLPYHMEDPARQNRTSQNFNGCFQEPENSSFV